MTALLESLTVLLEYIDLLQFSLVPIANLLLFYINQLECSLIFTCEYYVCL